MEKLQDRLLTVEEVSEYLMLAKSQVYRMTQKKQIPFIRLRERRVVIRESDLQALLEQHVKQASS